MSAPDGEMGRCLRLRSRIFLFAFRPCRNYIPRILPCSSTGLDWAMPGECRGRIFFRPCPKHVAHISRELQIHEAGPHSFACRLPNLHRGWLRPLSVANPQSERQGGVLNHWGLLVLLDLALCIHLVRRRNWRDQRCLYSVGIPEPHATGLVGQVLRLGVASCSVMLWRIGRLGCP